MRKYIYIAIVLLVSSCSLDTLPGGDVMTGDQKDKVVSLDPDKFSSEVNALSANLITFNTLNLAKVDHTDFGFASLCIIFDSSGADFVSQDTGYNWYASTMKFRDRLANSFESRLIWTILYRNVKQANDILAVALPAVETSESANVKNKFELYAGQAYANRAFSYLNLVQSYQFTYVGHEDSPAVPLVLLEGDERATPTRASVKAVYEVILDDLGKAIELLDGKGTTSKDQVSLQVAYGLRARANLVMQNWAEAATDAVKAQEGFTPYSLAEVSVPAFNDAANNKSWMWANIITPENRIVTSGIINWPSHMCSFTGNGYAPYGAFRMINKFTWADIPSTDVRKTWWVDEDLKSPYVDELTTLNSEEEVVPYTKGMGWFPYTNLKFGAYQNIVDNVTNASDWVLMRVEEMILIEAEAKAMGGDLAGGKNVLKNFITQYRDPSYSLSTAGSKEEFQDEVWFQRRIELWGEGFALHDLLRLKKPIVRGIQEGKNVNSNFGSTAAINLPAEAPILLYLVPEKEIEGSNGVIKPGDNNPTIPAPMPLGAE